MSERPSVDGLIAELEAATKGNRALDVEIAIVALGWKLWKSKHGHWVLDGPNDERVSTFGDPVPPKYDPDTGKPNREYLSPPLWALADRGDFPPYTTSIDAAVTLLPPWSWRTGNLPNGRGFADLGTQRSLQCVEGATPALALCIALLKSKTIPQNVL